MEKLLNKLSKYDQSLFMHSKKTAELARKMGILLSADDNLLYTAGFLHDIGKLFIDPRIIKKPGILNMEERKMIDLHSTFGYLYLQINDYPLKICETVLLHHGTEKNPYKILYDKENTFYGNIIRACDIYDAMTNDRIYHNRYDLKTTFSVLTTQKEPISPEIINALKEVVL